MLELVVRGGRGGGRGVGCKGVVGDVLVCICRLFLWYVDYTDLCVGLRCVDVTPWFSETYIKYAV